jgi:hypothetical protein
LLSSNNQGLIWLRETCSNRLFASRKGVSILNRIRKNILKITIYNL